MEKELAVAIENTVPGISAAKHVSFGTEQSIDQRTEKSVISVSVLDGGIHATIELLTETIDKLTFLNVSNVIIDKCDVLDRTQCNSSEYPFLVAAKSFPGCHVECFPEDEFIYLRKLSFYTIKQEQYEHDRACFQSGNLCLVWILSVYKKHGESEIYHIYIFPDTSKGIIY